MEALSGYIPFLIFHGCIEDEVGTVFVLSQKELWGQERALGIFPCGSGNLE